ncbi:MAG: MBL fold metallo-hydrolase [Proteobacteria bacterium]|nr:MBL fold metallo-hydrolase [Pseudomonadota bacterium]MBU1710922.1 MBL fold metallo-hydrolase [Pseudomonadota bacterium]
MKIKFWGVRGSIPCPGPATVQYGGNTACIEVRIPGIDRVIIIDAGSGIRELGNFIMANDLPKGPINADIYLTHTHWDHIMGFPFFTPSYIPGTKIKVHGPINHEVSLEKAVGGQLTYRYFPINENWLAADISYVELKEEVFDLGGGAKLITKYLNHPITCIGYRFEYNGKVFCTCYDTEPFRNGFDDPSDPSYDEATALEAQPIVDEQNRMIEELITGADLLVYDAQYTKAEYASKVDWGHTPMEFAIESANRMGVKALALFHHDPMRSDQNIEELSKVYCVPGKYGPTDVFFAREGMVIEL